MKIFKLKNLKIMSYASYGTDEAVKRGRRFIENLNEELTAVGFPAVMQMPDRDAARYHFLSSNWGPTVEKQGGQWVAICRRSNGGNPEKIFLSISKAGTSIE